MIAYFACGFAFQFGGVGPVANLGGLAPLTGLVEGIVDLTATGTTLRENGLVIREELFSSTARLIANPVAHKLKAAAVDDVVARMRESLR